MEESKDLQLGEQIVAVVKTIYDPEIPVDIYELGLIYDVLVNEDNEVKILMTLTSPNCPVAETLPVEVEEKVKSIDAVKDAEVEITFDPPWTQELMSEAAKLELGML
ncbi:MAG: SUF system Fe-S cluster assembly protein [Flavobacteriia bacterium]|nr:SUF system Fe-S cluster assembly protein [Flavobacteriia bacterium]